MKSRPTISTRRGAAFTILELLTAMTVLLLILGILGAVLGNARELWRAGTDRNRLLTGARAALDLITADLEQAVANSNLIFNLVPDDQTQPFGFNGNALYFYRTASSPHPNHRAVEQVWIGVEPVTNQLGRSAPGHYQLTRKSLPFSAYESWPVSPQDARNRIDPQPSAPLLESMAGLRFFVPHPEITTLEALFSNNLDDLVPVYPEADGHRLPAFVDIYLELLPPDTARRAAGLPENRQADFVEENAIRLTRRIALIPSPLP